MAIDRVALEFEVFVVFEIFVDFATERFGCGFIWMGLGIEFDVALGAQIHDGIADAAVAEVDAADAPAASLEVAPLRARVNHQFFDSIAAFFAAFSSELLRFLNDRQFIPFILLKTKNRRSHARRTSVRCYTIFGAFAIKELQTALVAAPHALFLW